MTRKTLLCAPFGLTMLAAAWGCGGAPTGSEGTNGEEVAAGGSAPTQETTPPDEAKPAEESKPGDNVGQTQQKWLGYGYPGYGFGYGYPGYAYGGAYGYPGYAYGYNPYGYGVGYGVGRAWGYGTSITCVNGFCY